MAPISRKHGEQGRQAESRGETAEEQLSARLVHGAESKLDAIHADEPLRRLETKLMVTCPGIDNCEGASFSNMFT